MKHILQRSVRSSRLQWVIGALAVVSLSACLDVAEAREDIAQARDDVAEAREGADFHTIRPFSLLD